MTTSHRCSIERILLLSIALVVCHNWYLALQHAHPHGTDQGGRGVKTTKGNHPWLDSFYSSTLTSARSLKRLRRKEANHDGNEDGGTVNQPNGDETEENVGDDALGISYLQDLFQDFIQSSIAQTNNGENNGNSGVIQQEGSSASKEPYILSPICGGCQHAFRDPLDPKTNFACNDVMKRRKNQLKLNDKWREKLKGEWEGRWKDVLSDSLGGNTDVVGKQHEAVMDMLNSTAIQAAIEKEAVMGATLEGFKVTGEEIESCKICNVDTCWQPYVNGENSNKEFEGQQRHLFKYWRYDQTAPEMTNPKTLSLPSIPKSQRIPPERFDDIQAYLKEVYAHFLPSNNNADADTSNGGDSANNDDTIEASDTPENNANAGEANDEEEKSKENSQNSTKDEKNSIDPFSTPFLIEYNPSLAPIPKTYKANLPPNATYLLSLRVTPANNCFPREIYHGEDMSEVKEAVYQSPVNHLGLALLDDELNLIAIDYDGNSSVENNGNDKADAADGNGDGDGDGMPRYYNIVIDLDRQLGVRRYKQLNKGLTGEPAFMDYRVFTLNDEIYLHANADLVVLAPLDLKVLGFGKSSDKTEDEEAEKGSEEEKISEKGNDGENVDKEKDDDEKNGTEKKKDDENKEGPIKLTNLYGGSEFQVTLRHPLNTVWSGGDHGKNYALFTIPNNAPDNTNSDPDPIYAELEIHPHHKLQQILPHNHTMLGRKVVNVRTRRNVKLDPTIKRKIVERGETIDTSSVTNVSVGLLPSFFTVDELWFPGKFAFKDFAHGGACCVLFSGNELIGDSELNARKENGQAKYPWGDQPSSLLVGIAHTHVQWKRWYISKTTTQQEKDLLPHTHYVSFAYAFEPHPPFRILARSGYFCLGFSQDTDGGILNPHSILTTNRKLKQYNETFECPQMHFVSSFVEKVGDESRAVIGYGLNDCTPRLVEVEKREIGRLLFPDPWEMVLEKG